MRIGIDASNLRGGGGITHLVALLSHVDVADAEFERVVVWGARDVLRRLPERCWLVKANPDLARATNPSTMPATVYDKTHFNEEANKVIGGVVAAELKRGVPELAPYIE